MQPGDEFGVDDLEGGGKAPGEGGETAEVFLEEGVDKGVGVGCEVGDGWHKGDEDAVWVEKGGLAR